MPSNDLILAAIRDCGWQIPDLVGDDEALMNVPPLVVYKAHQLTDRVDGDQTLEWDDWVQAMARRRDNQLWFAHHGIEVPA